MNKRLVNKRNQILKVIDRADYYAILDFLEIIFLADYDLKIFKARKMSNLFLALKELMLAEDGGRVRIEYERKFKNPDAIPIIIADWAFDYLDFLYPGRTIQSVLLIDDIIIHGRTLSNLYHLVANHYTGAKIDVMTYAMNKDDYVDIPAIKNAYAKESGSIEVCRQYSQKFVDIFMAVNQPYTSYVPNIAIRMNDSDKHCDVKQDIEKLKNWINGHDAISSLYTSTQKKIPFLKTRVWVGTGGVNNILIPSLRIYHNEETDEYAVIPMVSLKPITQDILKAQLKNLAEKNTYLEPFAKRWKDDNVSIGRMDYRVLIYTMSALWGRYFFKKRKLFENYIDIDFEVREEERMNFGGELLDRRTLGQFTESSLEELFNQLYQITENYKAPCLAFPSSDTNPTLSKIAELNNILDSIITNQENSRQDLRYKWEHIVRQFLREDSELDELEWKNWVEKYKNVQNPTAPLRIPGLPIVLFMEKAPEYEKKIAFKEILKAIDHGEGSIVPEAIETVDKDKKTIYYISSIHAGEQNYKYAEEKYYAELYGMYLIERHQNRKRQHLKESNLIENRTAHFVTANERSKSQKLQLLESLGKTDDIFLNKMKDSSVTGKFGKPLILDFFLHVGDADLDRVVSIVYDLIGRTNPNAS